MPYHAEQPAIYEGVKRKEKSFHHQVGLSTLFVWIKPTNVIQDIGMASYKICMMFLIGREFFLKSAENS
jgi:hypothetical protein